MKIKIDCLAKLLDMLKIVPITEDNLFVKIILTFQNFPPMDIHVILSKAAALSS